MRSILLAVLLLSACREAPAPFTPDNPFADFDGRLTYNPRDDHAPVWNRAGDTVYYAAESYPDLPVTDGVLLAVPRTGGVARLIAPALQLGAAQTPRLAAPALSLDGNRIAFFELTDVRDREFQAVTCATGPPGPAIDTAGTNSVLQEAVLRIREIESTATSDVARLSVRFAGRVGTPPDTVYNTAYPFQRLFEREGVPVFRASWSPDGTRVVFSNGSSLYVWGVGQAAAAQLAGTEDGIMPAWSPDGNWIAFSKPFRGEIQHTECRGWFRLNLPPFVTFARTIYTPLTRDDAELLLIRPNGSERQSLGFGDAPAWTPDSRAIIAHRGGSLVRVSVESGIAAPIANTQNGYEPAVSPDGRSLAFARRTPITPGEGFLRKGNYDIWVVPL